MDRLEPNSKKKLPRAKLSLWVLFGLIVASGLATLVVWAATRSGDFTVTSAPARQTVLQGKTTTYAITVTRSKKFTGQVTLAVRGLPKRATAKWSLSNGVKSNRLPAKLKKAKLTITTKSSTPKGSFSPVVTAASGKHSHRATIKLKVTAAQEKSFLISGDLASKLYPGAKAPLNLSLTNPYKFNINVTKIDVGIGDATSKPGCSGTHNFKVTQLSAAYPLTLPPGTTQLSSLVSDSKKWPQFSMLDLPTNQDACKGARVSLHYSGSATK